VKIAIIGGSGKMGRWFTDFLLKEGMEVIISGRNQDKLQVASQQLGVEAAGNIEAVKQADVILISVPIDDFEESVKQIAPHIRPEQVVIDITSIKESPVEIMHRHIKQGTTLGVHPMFGPGARDIAGQNFILTPTKDAENDLAQKVREYLETQGARVTMMTPRQHDEVMSVVLGLAHFIALVSADTLLSLDKSIPLRNVSGSTYKLLLTLAESVITEDPEFCAALQMKLPNRDKVNRLLQSKLADWSDIVAKQDRQQFTQKMKALRHGLEQDDPELAKAYENMYKLIEGL
jgi:prephenate dehydrogenase